METSLREVKENFMTRHDGAVEVDSKSLRLAGPICYHGNQKLGKKKK